MSNNNDKDDTHYRMALSPLVKGLYDAHAHYGALASAPYLFVFWEPFGDIKHFECFGAFANPWIEHDQFKHYNPDAHLVMALDLNRPFEEQWPEHFKEKLETFDSFIRMPIIQVPDRTGHVPEDLKKKALDGALRTELKEKFTLVTNPDAAEIKREKPTTRPNYLRPV